MANRELPLEDLLGFMDDKERARWDESTEAGRAVIREELTSLWYAIPDPTENDIKPPYMHAVDWQSYLFDGPLARQNVFNFHRRKWKKDRKGSARAELEKRKATELLPEPTFREPTTEELRAYVFPNELPKFDDPATQPSVKSRIRQAARRKWMAAHRPPKRIANEDIVRDTGYTDRQVRESLQRRFLPKPHPPDVLLSNRPKIPRDTFREKLGKLADSNLFWSGGIGMAFIALGFEWARVPPKVTITMLMIAWMIIAISTYRHKFFESWHPWAARIFNAILWLGIGAVLAGLWLLFRPQ